MPEIAPLVFSYSHLVDFPRANDALQALKKVASLVKPLMRGREWKVKQLTEFYPEQTNLLGLNVNRGDKICLRLRYPGDRSQFLPIEQVTDTMLHELAHNVHSAHDDNFKRLWDQLRDEHESLAMKGYTGEGFLSKGHQLGGRRIPREEARRLARVQAEKRRALNAGSGQRLGGARPQSGQDIRKVIADAIERRNRTLRGCANDNQTQTEIREIADTATKNGFRTHADEDAANEAAIGQAFWELVQEEEKAKKGDAYIPPDRNVPVAFEDASAEPSREPSPKRSSPRTWTCDICTLDNPDTFLCCDACGAERSEEATRSFAERPSKHPRTVVDLTKDSAHRNKPTRPALSSLASGSGSGSKADTGSSNTVPKSTSGPQTWTCNFCGRIRERQWWSCDLCGAIKTESK